MSIKSKMRMLNGNFSHITRLILSRKNNFWLRIGYSRKYDNPVTFLKVIECDLDCNNSNNILIKKVHIENGFKPIHILLEDEKDNDYPEKVS